MGSNVPLIIECPPLFPFEYIYKIFSRFRISKFECVSVFEGFCQVNIHLTDGVVLQCENLDFDETIPNSFGNLTERFTADELECGTPVLIQEFVQDLTNWFSSECCRCVWILTAEPGVHQIWFDFFHPMDLRFVFFLETDRQRLNASSFFALSDKMWEKDDKTKKVFRGQVICRFLKEKKRPDFEFLQTLVHPNIERVNEICENDDFVFIRTDEYTTHWSNDLPDDDKHHAIDDVLSGLEFLNQHNVFHGSIQENNIAWNGVSWIITDLMGKPRKTINEFRSPHETPNDPKNDLWRFICIMIERFFHFGHGEFDPLHSKTDARLNETLIGQTLAKMQSRKLCDADYQIVRQIFQTFPRADDMVFSEQYFPHVDNVFFHHSTVFEEQFDHVDVQMTADQMVLLEI